MLGYLFPLVIVTFAVYVAAAQISLVKARARADQVITGGRQANTTELNRYIIRLTGKGVYPIGRCEQDRQRINQLRNIRNDLTTKHN